jgi:hypothetical protein
VFDILRVKSALLILIRNVIVQASILLGAIMETNNFINRLATWLLIMLAWSFPAFCGEIHSAAKTALVAQLCLPQGSQSALHYKCA